MNSMKDRVVLQQGKSVVNKLSAGTQYYCYHRFQITTVIYCWIRFFNKVTNTRFADGQHLNLLMLSDKPHIYFVFNKVRVGTSLWYFRWNRIADILRVAQAKQKLIIFLVWERTAFHIQHKL